MVQNSHIGWGCTITTTNFDQSFGKKNLKRTMPKPKSFRSNGQQNYHKEKGPMSNEGFIHNVESII